MGNRIQLRKWFQGSSFRRDKYAYFLIAPGLILILIILLYPLIRGIISSFFQFSPASTSFQEFVGLKFYKDLLKDKIFILAFKNSILWTISIVIAQYIIGLGISLILNEDLRGRWIFRSLILIPWVVPNIAAAMTWKWMYSTEYGIINYILKFLNIIQDNINWLGSSSIALKSVIITSIWKGVPFTTIVLLAGLQVIDKTQYEVARIDGANTWQIFKHITLPGIKNISITVILLQSIWTFSQFDLIYVMTKGGPSNSSQIVPVYTYITAFNFFKFNYAAAIGCVGLVIIAAISFFYIRKISKEG